MLQPFVVHCVLAVAFVVVSSAGAVPAAAVELSTSEFAVLAESDGQFEPEVAVWPVAVAAAFAAIVVAAAAAVAAVVAVGIAVVESAAGIAIAVAGVVAGPALEVEVLESVEWFESEWERVAPESSHWQTSQLEEVASERAASCSPWKAQTCQMMLMAASSQLTDPLN